MPPRFSSALLRSLRNEIPVADLIRGPLDLPWKEREGFLRFLCPRCGEFHTATHPKTNLARCFRCEVNFNPIDLVMAVERCRFVDAVKILIPLLEPSWRRAARPARHGWSPGHRDRGAPESDPGQRRRPRTEHGHTDAAT